MPAPVERFLEAHPDVAAAWYPPLSRVAETVLTLPGLGALAPLAQRVEAVACPAGWTSVASHPASPPPTDPTRLTVLSANLWHDWPRQHRWTQRLDAVAQLVVELDVDVLLLQEVARTPSMHADAWLAERLGMSCAYARANGSLEGIGFEEGLAILGRFPLGEISLRQLGRSRNPWVRRAALAAVVRTPFGDTLAVSAHLALRPSANATQIKALRAWVEALSRGGIAVVGGDFNAPEGRPEVEQTRLAWTDTFRATHPDAEAFTHAGGAPWRRWSRPRRLDYVFLVQPRETPWRVLDAGHVDAPAAPHSDHRAVLARLAPP
jgi:endonuclease/exonuclease/phosphatase family metal-dependent hydrolase